MESSADEQCLYILGGIVAFIFPGTPQAGLRTSELEELVNTELSSPYLETNTRKLGSERFRDTGCVRTLSFQHTIPKKPTGEAKR